MTRKAERRARVLRWLATLAAGMVAAAAGLILLPGTGGTAFALVAVAGAAAIGHRWMIAPPGVAILTYHSVSPTPDWLPWSREISVHPDTFARHLRTLAAMRVTVLGSRTLVARRRAGLDVPAGSVALHFDDGYLDNHRYAAPLLRAHGFAATFFPSLDFIEPGETVRTHGACEGYMRWAELAELEAEPSFEVEPHGVAHARVPVSDAVVGTLDTTNWRRNAWLQWDATPGPKHDWFRMAVPAAVPLGSAIPASGLALAERAWRSRRRESETELAERIEADLTACRTAFGERLGIAPQIFCWPENKRCAQGQAIASALGYLATTGGKGRNTAQEPADTLSRIHIGDRVLGFRWLSAEALHLRASVRLMHGNHYWYLVVAPMNAMRRVVFAVRSALGQNFH